MSRRAVLAWLGVSAVSIGIGALAGCHKRSLSFDNMDISGNSSFASDFSLPDTRGHLRSMADYRGKVVVLFFGYTQCPDVCPTSLAELAEAKKRLGLDGDRLQVLFVSVDPQRDSPAVLEQYTAAFDPTFIALRPTDDAAVQAVTKAFHFYVAKSPEVGSANGASAAYAVDHTAASFVFDPQGKLRLYARDGEGVDRWVHDVKQLLQERA